MEILSTRSVRLLELQPRTKRVYLVGGASKYDKFYEELARAQLQSFESRVSVNYLFGLSISDLEKTVAHLPPQSVLYFLTMLEDGAGNRYFGGGPLDRVSSVANAPIYGWVDSEMDHRIVGGSLLSLEKTFDALARVALRVLHGEDPNNIPITNFDPNIPMFDWRQLHRWNIDEGRLRSGSVVKFREPTFWEHYKWRIVAVISILIVSTALAHFPLFRSLGFNEIQYYDFKIRS